MNVKDFFSKKHFLRRVWLLGMVISLLTACAAFRSEESFLAVNIKPDTPEYYEFIALYYYQNRKYRQAIHYYEVILTRFSARADAYDEELAWATYEIGFCYYKMKRYDQAYEKFEQVSTDYRNWGAITLARQRMRDLKERFPKQIETAG